MREIEITRGRGGFPSRLHPGFIGFETFGSAEAFAKRFRGHVVLLCRRDGWQYWESRGPSYGPLTTRAEDYGEGVDAWDDENAFEDYCRDDIRAMVDGDFSLDELEKKIAEMTAVRRALQCKGDDEVVLARNGLFVDMCPKRPMSQTIDVYRYEVGVELDPDELEEEELSRVRDEAGEFVRMSHLLSSRIERDDFSVRAWGTLVVISDIVTLGQLCVLTRKDLLSFRGVGRWTADDIEATLMEKGLGLGMELEEYGFRREEVLPLVARFLAVK